MEKNYDKDDFLAKWASGALSEKEKKEFENSEDHTLFNAILEGVDALEVPPYDKEQLFKKVKEEKLSSTKVVPMFRKWVYAAAASVVLLLGFMLFFDQTITHATSYGEQLSVQLPDGSEVILNANTELEYVKSDWAKKRTVNLKGQAYFKVKKGSTFIVETDQGSVTVLGTQFTTNAHNNLFEVICYEGTVEVATEKQTDTINKGEAVRVMDKDYEKWNFTNVDEPTWIQEESSFTNAPLAQVIKALENQYGVTIDSSKIDKSLRYTGSFTHTHLEKALKTVFNPLEITFTFVDKNTIVLADN